MAPCVPHLVHLMSRKRFRKLKKDLASKPKQPRKRICYAGFVDRTKAFITDLFMIYTPILYFIAYIVLDGKEGFLGSTLAPFVAVMLYGIIYALFLSKSGQTPGKRAYEIKVVDALTQELIPFWRAFVRFVAFLLSAMTIVGLVYLLYNTKKQALHDIIAHTVEIETGDAC